MPHLFTCVSLDYLPVVSPKSGHWVVAHDDNFSMIHLNHAHMRACLSDTSASDATTMFDFCWISEFIVRVGSVT